LVLSYSATAIRFDASSANLKAPGIEESRVDTVIVFKTLDTGSTFLDMRVFPHLPHVSRWQKEISADYKDGARWGDLAEWFGHRPGEEIVGASVEFGVIHDDWCPLILPLFTREKHGRILLIKLNRSFLQKRINMLRGRAIEHLGCSKAKRHLPECTDKTTTIDANYLFGRVLADDRVDKKIDDAIACSLGNRSSIFVAKEEYLYDDLQSCQGIPQRINRYFGKDEDGCNHSSTWLQDHPLKPLHEIVENYAEVQQRFWGTKWWDEVTSNDMRLFREDDVGI